MCTSSSRTSRSCTSFAEGMSGARGSRGTNTEEFAATLTKTRSSQTLIINLVLICISEQLTQWSASLECANWVWHYHILKVQRFTIFRVKNLVHSYAVLNGQHIHVFQSSVHQRVTGIDTVKKFGSSHFPYSPESYTEHICKHRMSRFSMFVCSSYWLEVAGLLLFIFAYVVRDRTMQCWPIIVIIWVTLNTSV